MSNTGNAEQAIESTQDGLRVRIEMSDPWIFVRLDGALDIHTVALLDERLHLAEVLAEPPARVAIDLSRLRFCDSSGLNLLIRTWKRLGTRGGRLLLLRPQGQLRRLLTWTGLGRILVSQPQTFVLAGP